MKALFHNLPKGTANTDWGTWAPRFGFAYDLTGKQTTVLRGGYGMFYERVEGNFLFSAVNNPPFVQQQVIYNGSLENPSGGALPVFPSTISNSHYLDMKVPRTMNWSLGIQQKLSRTAMLDITYVGSSAANLSYQQDINQLPEGTITANPGVNINALRPYPGYADIYQYNTGANFIYHSLQVQVKKDFASGGLLNLAYTYSKGRTDANAYNYQPMDSYNLRRDWGPSSYNRGQYLRLQLCISFAVLAATRSRMVSEGAGRLAIVRRDDAAIRIADERHTCKRHRRHRRRGSATAGGLAPQRCKRPREAFPGASG